MRQVFFLVRGAREPDADALREAPLESLEERVDAHADDPTTLAHPYPRHEAPPRALIGTVENLARPPPAELAQSLPTLPRLRFSKLFSPRVQLTLRYYTREGLIPNQSDYVWLRHDHVHSFFVFVVVFLHEAALIQRFNSV